MGLIFCRIRSRIRSRPAARVVGRDGRRRRARDDERAEDARRFRGEAQRCHARRVRNVRRRRPAPRAFVGGFFRNRGFVFVGRPFVGRLGVLVSSESASFSRRSPRLEGLRDAEDAEDASFACTFFFSPPARFRRSSSSEPPTRRNTVTRPSREPTARAPESPSRATHVSRRDAGSREDASPAGPARPTRSPARAACSWRRTRGRTCARRRSGLCRSPPRARPRAPTPGPPR